MCKCKITLFFLFLCSFFTACYSQARFGPGYYVSHQNDTVKGFIKYHGNSYGRIIFRSDLHSDDQIISPTEAKFFAFESGNSYKLQNFAQTNKPVNEVFARILVVGTVDLYVFYNQYLMVSPTKGQFILTKVKAVNNDETMAQHQRNIGAFNVLFFDCPALRGVAEKTNITEEPLIQLVRKFHECKSLPYKEFSAEKRKNVQWGVYGSLSFSSISFSGDEEALNVTSFETSVNPGVGAMVLLTPSRKHSSIFSMQMELFYMAMHYSGNAYVEKSISGYDFKTTTSTSIDYHRIAPRIGFRFTARSNSLNPYISFGINGPSFIATKSQYVKSVKINDGSEKTETTSIDIASISGWAGIGVKKPMKNGSAIFLDGVFEMLPASDGGKVTVVNPRIGFIF